MALGATARLDIVAHDRTGGAMRSAIRNYQRFVGQVDSSGRVVERSTGRIHSSLGRLMRFMGQQVTGAIRSFFYGIRMGVVGAGVAVAAFVSSSLGSFKDFDKKIRETTALISGSGKNSLAGSMKFLDAQYKEFYKTLLRMAPQMRRTPQQMASGAYEIVQAGIQNPRDVRALLGPAAKGATAGGGTTEQSARVLIQIMNALKMGTTGRGAGKRASAVMDQIFQAINLGVGVDFPGISQSIGKFIGSAGVTFKGGSGKAGMRTLQELLATYVFSTKQGARQSDVGVGIQDVIKTISNPSVKSAKFAKSIGLGNMGAEFLNKYGFIGSLEHIIKKMKDAGYQGAKLQDAIGRLFADVRGRRIVSYAANLGMVNEALRDQGLYLGANDRAFKEQGKSLQAAEDTFKSYWETLKIATGGAAAPYARSGMNAITHMLQGAGVFGPGQDLVDKYQSLHGAKAKARYLGGLDAHQREQFDQANKFNRAGFGGKLTMVADRGLRTLQAWWRRPDVQMKFQSAIQAVLNKAFEAASLAVKQIPSIFQFGRKVGAEILRGVVDGFKNSVSGMFSLGGGGGGNPFGKANGGFEQVTQMLMGGALIRGTAGKSPLMAMLGTGAGGLMAGLPGPLAALMGVAQGGRRFRQTGGVKGALGSLTGGDGSETIGTMRIAANNVYVNGRNVTGGGHGAGKIRGKVVPPVGGGAMSIEEMQARQAAKLAGPGLSVVPAGWPTSTMKAGALFPRPGYTWASSIKGQRQFFRGPGPSGGIGSFVSPAEAFYGAGAAGPMFGRYPGTGGMGPKTEWQAMMQGAYGRYPPAGPPTQEKLAPFSQKPGSNKWGGLTEAEYRRSLGVFAHLKEAALDYQFAAQGLVKTAKGKYQTVAAAAKKFAGSKTGRAIGGAGLFGAGFAQGMGQTPGASLQLQLAQGAITGVGTAAMLAGPEVGIPAMVLSSLLSAYVGDKYGPKAPRDANFPKSKARDIYNMSGGMNAMFGPGGRGLPSAMINKQNSKLFKYAGRQANQVRFMEEALNRALKMPWNKSDEHYSAIQEALFYAGNNDKVIDTINEMSKNWSDWAKTKEVDDIANKRARAAQGLKDAASKKERQKQRRRAKRTVASMLDMNLNNDPVFDAGFGPGSYSPRGGSGRPAPDPTGKKGKKYQETIGQFQNFFESIKDPIGKMAEKAGKVGPTSFAFGFQSKMKTIKSTPEVKQSIDQALTDITDMVNSGIGGTGTTAGPSSAAPPGGGATGGGGSNPRGAHGTRTVNTTASNGDGARVFSADNIRGVGDTLAGGMTSAGETMAMKLASMAATKITKKKMAGPMGKAYKALRWLYQQVGKPYIWGGGHPPNPGLAGYDCSGLASSALQVMGSNLAGTTYTMLPETSPGAGIVKLGFNDPHKPTHMGINVLGKWFEAKGRAYGILGPGKARSNWAYVGVPKFHSGGVYDSGTVRGEGPALLKDGEMVVRPTTDGGLQAHPVAAGGGIYINGPLIQTAHIRSDRDIHRVAAELVDLLEKKKQNARRAG